MKNSFFEKCHLSNFASTCFKSRLPVLIYSTPRAYLEGGAWCHGPPPLGRQDSIISIEWYSKVQHGPSLCKFGTKLEHTNGQNVTEDFVLFMGFT